MLQWMDDFTSYGTGYAYQSAMLNGLYAQANGTLVADPDPNAGGEPVLRVEGNTDENSTITRKVLSSPQSTVGVMVRQWCANLPASTGQAPRIRFRDASNANLCYISVDPSGYIQAWRCDTGGDVLIGASSSPVVIANGWQHIETKIVFSGTLGGSVEVRIEGAQVLAVSGINTAGTYSAAGTCQNVCLSALGQFWQHYIKDFAIWDGSGAVDNNFLGTYRVYKILPDGDVSLGWNTSSGATGWNLINEAPPDDDGSYISAPSPAPPPAIFSMSDLPANTTSVRAVMLVHRSRKTDAGDGSLQGSLISGGVTGAGANRAMTTAYTYYADIFDQDPNGNVNWSKASVDALELKLDRTA